MSEQAPRPQSLLEIELEVEAEAREWKRQRLGVKLQELADKQGAVFPPQPKKSPAASAAGVGGDEQRRRDKN